MEKSIKYSQYSESEPAKLVLIHEPSYEIFMSMLHPAGSLYKDVTSESLVAKDFENFRNILNDRGIRVISVREALIMDRPGLIELAKNSLQYDFDEMDQESKKDPLFSFYLSDEYKDQILNKMSDDQLVDCVLTKPFFTLKKSKKNTVKFCFLLRFQREPILVQNVAILAPGAPYRGRAHWRDLV